MNILEPHHHGSSDHTHMSHASHMITSYRRGSGGYVVSTKGPSRSHSSLRSVQGSSGLGQGGHVSPSPKFVDH